METRQQVIEDFSKLIMPNTEIVVIAPWNGKPVPVTIRMLDSVSLNSCGEFNTLAAYNLEEREMDEEEQKGFELLVKTKNIHENILKLALVSPTFDEITELLMEKDYYKVSRQRLEKIKADIDELESMEQKRKLMNELELTEVSISFLLPEDFTTTIVEIELQKNATDLNKLTKDTLLTAGFLGEKYNSRPSEYLEGSFTEKNKADIDITALTLVYEYREASKIEKSSKMRWVRGGTK